MALCGAAPCTSPSWAAGWADPTLEFAQPDLEGIRGGQRPVYYIYHVASGKFMSNGADADVKLVVSDTGQDVTLSYGSDYELITHEGKADYSDAKSYRLSMMNAPTVGGFHEMHLDAGTTCWVDHSKEGHILWDIVPQDGGAYRIRVNADDPIYGANTGNPAYADAWMAALPDADGGWKEAVVPMVVPGTAGYEDAGFDWKFVAPQAYDVYIAKKNVLKPQLEAADEAGYADYAKYKALYENPSATAEEVEGAAEELKDAVLDFMYGGASEAKPADVTSLIANASFGDGTAGWTTWRADDRDNFQVMPDASSVTVSDGADVRFFERWVQNPPQGDWYVEQELSGIPDGKYRLGAYIMTQQTVANDGADAPVGLFLYAKTLTGENRKKADTPSPDGGAYAAPYTVDFSVIGGTATIGMRSEGSRDGWSAVGNFTLKYMGKAGGTTMRDALGQGISDAESRYAGELQPKKHSQSADKKYQDMIAAAEAAHADGALGDDALRSALESLQLCMDSLAQDVADYETLSQKIEELNTAWEESAFAGLEFPAYDDFLSGLETAYDGGTFDPAELDSIQPRSDRIWTSCVREALSDGEVDDATSLLVNPDLDKGGEGWTKTGDGQYYQNHSLAEVWAGTDWEVYQEVGNLPEGSYRITVQGFYKPASDNENQWHEGWGRPGDETNKIMGYFFGNDASVPLVHVTACPQDENVADNCEPVDWTDEAGLAGKWLTDGTASAQVIFEADRNNYLNEAVCYVGEDGKLRVGLRLSGVSWWGAWVAYDTFRLTYLGADNMEGATSTMEALVASAQELLAREDALTTQEAKDGLSAAIQAAKAADVLTPGTFKELSEALTSAIEAYDEAASAASALEAKATNHDNKISGTGDGSYEAYSETEGYGELAGLVGEILYEKIEADGMFSTLDEINDYSARLDRAYSKMLCGLVDFASASKDAPVDATGLIVNPGFQATGLNDAGETVDNPSSDGWTANGGWASSGLNYEIYDVDSCVVCQRLYNMPAGYYRVAYNGLYRDGGDGPIPAGVKRLHKEETLNAEVYLEANESKWSKKLVSIFEGVREGKYASSDVVLPDSLFPDRPDLIYHCVVNQVEGAKAAFESGAYEDGFSFRVEEGEEPVLGVRKIGAVERDWACFDNFRLTYYGEGDSNKPDDFTSSVEDAAAGGAATVASTAWYTVGGVRVAVPNRRGIYIRRDKMSDGTVRTAKVSVNH